MRFGIIGSGALGSLFGGWVHAAGHDVHLVDTWAEHVRVITERGLRIETSDGEATVVHPPATTDPADIGGVDVVVVLVKARHTETAIEAAAPLIGDETLVVTFQNGFGNVETIRETVPERRVLGGTTEIAARIVEPGTTQNTGDGATVVGGADRKAARRVADALSQAGIATEVADDAVSHVWNKQFIAVGVKPIAVLTGLRDGPLAEYHSTRHVLETLVEEAAAVARAKGIEIRDDPVGFVHDFCDRNYAHLSSALQDAQEERPTEIDYVNGAIVRYGEEVGVATPYNRAVTNLVDGKERSYLEAQPGE
jgi:2-dehydropantoate 2-reductase